jgi:hypothetical protein
VYKKQLNKYEFALNFEKQLLGTGHNLSGGGVFSNKLKMACAQNLKALII